jgi:hypothetical protein
MGQRAQYEIPLELREAQQRFEQWRSSQSGRKPLPESLWSLATAMALQNGVFRTAQVLRLDYTKLKRVMIASSPIARPKRAAKPAFVELLAASATHPCECVIQVEGPRGRMRVEWKGSIAPDLPGLSRVLWEPGA